jgi:hypothetical protein
MLAMPYGHHSCEQRACVHKDDVKCPSVKIGSIPPGHSTVLSFLNVKGVQFFSDRKEDAEHGIFVSALCHKMALTSSCA